MKKLFRILLVILLFSVSNLYAQDITTVEAKNTDISDNLDIEAVASLFGESKDLEEFEKKLNDPKTQISNLDLNEDGEVDYLRVVETSKGNTHLITIQAVIEKDQYQDVATIDVEKDSKGETQVQVVGDVYMYGPGYIVEPVYVHPPVIFLFFWGPLYSPWRSPFYWGYYPPYYHPWRPYPTRRYQKNVNVHIDINNSYNYTSVRKSKTSIELQKQSRRNDFGSKNPNKSFTKRNPEVKEKQELNQKKQEPRTTKTKTNDAQKSTRKQVQKDWKPASKKTGTKDRINDHKVPTPSGKKAPKAIPNKSKNDVKSNGRKIKQPIGRPAANRPINRPKRGLRN